MKLYAKIILALAFRPIDPKNSNRLIITAFEFASYYSGDRSASWEKTEGFIFQNAYQPFFDPADPSKAYIGTFGGGGLWHGLLPK